VTPIAQNRIHAQYAALSLAFEANEGQADPQIQYVARGNGYKLGLTSSKAIMSLPGRKGQSEVRDMMMNKRRGAAGVKAMMKKRALTAHHDSSPAAAVEMNLLGADPHAQLIAGDLQQGKVNYFLGKDPSKWHSNIPLYGRVSYRSIYPGIDLAFHGAGKQLEFDYLVNPSADAARIAVSFRGADSLHTDNAGNLILATSAGSIQLNKPIAYQSKNGGRELVDAKFVLTGKNHVAFELGPYDHNRELVIDPSLFYSTYFGGDGADYASGIAVDANGNAYVAGATDSTTIPGNPTFVGGVDSFVTKLDPNGLLIVTSIFGGTQDDFPGGIAIDSAGVYIAGTTDSPDFPASVGQGFVGGPTADPNDAYAVKLDLNGNFVWGTCIAGTQSDTGLGVAVDSGHNVYVVGETFSNDLGGVGGGINPLPHGNAVNLGAGVGNDDGYIAKLTSDGSAYLLVSYIGGSNGDLATGVALDGSGNIYVSGETISNDLPTTLGSVQPACGTDANCNATSSTSFDDAFVVSIAANLSGYNYVTYYGGSNVDDAFAIAVDPTTGNAFVTGTTASTDLLSPGTTFQSTLAGTQNAFILELNSAGSTVTYNTYFGGDGTDFGLGIALDASDNIYFTGQTTSSSGSFPLVNPTQALGDGGSDAFVSVLSIAQGQLLFSTFLGGGGDEDQFQGSIGLDSAQNIFVSGDTDSGNATTDPFPTTTGAIDVTYGGGTCTDSVGNTVPCTDAFIASYNPATLPDFAFSATPLSPSAVNAGGSATSTITATPLNGYTGTVNLTCSVAGNGSPLPACSVASATLTVTTTGAAAALNRGASRIYYAMWLPVVGLSLVGMRFTTKGTRQRRLLGFLLLGLMMTALFFLPACSSSSSGGGGGCSGCTPPGTYTITVTGTDSVNASLTHAVALTLTVN